MTQPLRMQGEQRGARTDFPCIVVWALPEASQAVEHPVTVFGWAKSHAEFPLAWGILGNSPHVLPPTSEPVQALGTVRLQWSLLALG